MIKISSNTNQKKFHHPNEKFRFHSTRTFQGSNNSNWRAPENHQEASSVTRTSFPDISFFRSTPPPSDTAPPPPPPVTALISPVLTFQAETTLTKPEWNQLESVLVRLV